MICEICNENEVAWTLIPIGEGLPQSLCDSCLAIRGIVWSKENLPAEDIAGMLGPMFVRPPSPEEVANENPPAKGRKSESPKQRRQRRQALAEILTEAGETEAAQEIKAEGEAGGEAEAPAAAANE